MSRANFSGFKKRKRGDRVYRFKAFGNQGYPVEFKGSFQENVKALLEFGQMETGICDPMVSWSFQLEVHRQPSLHVFLFIVEEQVELSRNLCCSHCNYTGWGNHLICNKKYHFLLPSKDTVSACLSFEGNSSNTTDSLASKSNFIELQGHAMHGVFHSNGFGHLLCINGDETGSDLTGHQIMEFWDRLCTGLRAREVSLRDISQKRGMDLRILHAVAYGKPWFGQWGYVYGRGSFGINQLMYQNAIETLQKIPIDLLVDHLANDKNETVTTMSRYQILSGHSLISLVDLFHFMLELKSRLPKESIMESSHPGLLVDVSCRWSNKRVQMAIRVVIEALKRAEFRWISRQEVRDAARAYIGDTGLLDFVLKSLGNQTIGKYFVRRCMNPVTKVLEYCLEDISYAFSNQDGYKVNYNSKLNLQCNITWSQLMKDLFCLYKHILKENKAMHSTGILAHMPAASRIILDTKYFIKEYSREPDILQNHELYCSIVLLSESEIGPRKVITPHEWFMLKDNTTIDELRLEVEKTFRDLYMGLRNFYVVSVVNFEGIMGSDFVLELVKSGNQVIFEGKLAEENLDLGCILENAESNYIVDCCCGTTIDDGERMVSCDICEVWQHTRCVQIQNHEEVPNIFLCSACEQYL